MRYRQSILPLLVLLGVAPALASAQQSRPVYVDEQPSVQNRVTEEETVVTVDPDALPISIDRIQRRLAQEPAIRPNDARQVFRVQVIGRSPTIDEILGPNWRRGPVPASAMSHQEFLNMVTPRDVQGYAAFDNRQALMVAATSFALQWGLRQAMQKLDDARSERQREAAQREVDQALSALRKARREAGLPDW
jgi:hypothetical protein